MARHALKLLSDLSAMSESTPLSASTSGRLSQLGVVDVDVGSVPRLRLGNRAKSRLEGVVFKDLHQLRLAREHLDLARQEAALSSTHTRFCCMS